MNEFHMPPIVQTEAQKAYCVAAKAAIDAEERVKTILVEKWLGATLGGVIESRVQVSRNMPECRVAKLAAFARQHGIKACVGRWTGLLIDPAGDADTKLEQIVLGFDFGMHVSQAQIADFEQACIAG